jgi:DNA-binding transcriptional MerR regulator
MTRRLNIGEVARRSGLPARTIRFYEAEGVVGAPPRSASGYRMYGDHDVALLRLIACGRKLGLSPADLSRIGASARSSDCKSFVGTVVEAVESQRGRIDEQLRALRELKAQLAAFERQVRAAPCAERSDQRASQCGGVVETQREEHSNDGNDRPRGARRPGVRVRAAAGGRTRPT